jgi:hypothetical protein
MHHSCGAPQKQVRGVRRQLGRACAHPVHAQSNAKDFGFNCKAADAQELAHTPRMQNILRLTSLNQNLLHSTALIQNLLHFDALDQNPLDLIGFPVVGSCRNPAVSPHTSREVIRRRLRVGHTGVGTHTQDRKYFRFDSPRSKSFALHLWRYKISWI